MASRAKDASVGAHLHLAGALRANQEDYPHLQGLIGLYDTAVNDYQGATQVQTALMASKQDASKKVKTTRSEADRIGTIVKASLRQHYGPDSEKLVEFGLQPFRGRARKVKPAEETPEVLKASSPAAPPAVTDGGEE